MLCGLQDGLKTSGISFMWIILGLKIFLCFRGSYILNSQQETEFGVQRRVKNKDDENIRK